MAREGNSNKLNEMLEELKSSEVSAKKEKGKMDKGTAKDGQRTVYLSLEQVKDLEKIADNLGVKNFSEIMRLVVKAGIESVKGRLGV